MAVDVLTYNALAEINQGLRAKIVDLDASINALQSGGGGGGMSDAQKAVAASQGWQPYLGCLIPKYAEGTTSWSAGFKVCDTTSYKRCGASCTWTVPSGVTCARFQVWGAGTSSGMACCCSYGVPGSTGAYASVIIPVTAGNSYTLCAGCAYCCYPSHSGGSQDGCQSYVTGSGLSNFCAQGGQGDGKKMNQEYGHCSASASYRSATGNCYHYWQGMCVCYCQEFCIPSSLHHGASMLGYPRGNNRFHFPGKRSNKTYYGSATNGAVYGHNGMYSSFFMGGSAGMRSCVQHASVYGFFGCCDYPGSTSAEGCCSCKGGCCCSACTGYRQIPSASGSFTMKCGGEWNTCGDAGRMGMVCVSYS